MDDLSVNKKVLDYPRQKKQLLLEVQNASDQQACIRAEFKWVASLTSVYLVKEYKEEGFVHFDSAKDHSKYSSKVVVALNLTLLHCID